MPILYHPTASYQFYIAPGSSSVSITAAIFNLGGVTLDSESTVSSVQQPAGGDFDVARFAVPSGLVTTDATIDIDYVAENVKPSEYLTSAPAILHEPAGVTYMGTKTFLTFPNSTETSSFVYRANISLPLGGSTLELRRNSSDTQYVHVTRKLALDTTTVTNDAQFAAALDGAYSGNGLTLDAIYVNYNARMNDVWAAQTLSGADTRNTQRNTYLTIAPTGGNEISWSMNNDVPLNPRTSNTWILYKNITIGSSSDDWTSGNYYNEDYSQLLFDGCTFESKYNIIDYGYMKRPNGIRVTILGSQADVNSLVYGEYFYQGEGGPNGHSADSESTNFGYVGIANNLNVYEYGTSAGVSFASFNVYGTVPDVGVSGSFVAGATVHVAYNPVLNKGNSTAAPREFTLESYIGVSGDNMPIGDDGRTLISIISPTRKYQISGFMGFSGCNFINTPGPIMSYCNLVKDCFYNGHRSDICTGVACGINNRAVNTVIRRETNDYYGDQVTHIDLHQWWGTTASHPDQFHENFYYGGNLVEDEEGANISSLQHTLFDRSVCCSSNSHIFMRKSICRYKTDIDHNFLQLAGQFDHVGLHEVECIGVPGTPGDGVISYRMAYNDQRPANGVNLSNFYVHGCSASRFEVSFSSISGLPNINVRAIDVVDISDVSSYLNGVTTEGFGYGITFSDCSISPATQYGTFAADTANGMYRTNSGSGIVFVNTFVDRGTQLAAGVTGSGINSFTMYPDKFFIGFNSQTERDAFNSRNPKIQLTMIGDDAKSYTYAWDSVGSSPTWGTLSTVLYPADETTGTTWDSNWADLYARFGDNPQYDMGEPVEIIPWESFTTAKTEIQALSDGDTIDFGNRKFAAQVGDHDNFGINVTQKSFTMKNGRFSMGKTASWTPIGGGVYEAEHDFSDYGNPSFYLLDDNATNKPLMNINIDSQTSEMSPYRFCYHSGWFPIKDNQLDIDNGTVQYVPATVGGTTGPLYGWTITNPELKTKVNNLVSGVTMEGTTLGASAGPWVMVHSGPNAVATANIVSWDNSTGVMELAPMGERSTIINYRGTYCQFAICGLPDQTLNDGEYLVDMTNGITAGRVLYKPDYGTNPTDARIPVSDYGFRLGGGGCTFEIDGTRFEGNSQRDGQPAIIGDVNNTSSFTVKNCKMEDFTLGLRLAWSDNVTVDRNIITRSNVRGANVRDSVTLTNNIFTHVESYSGVAIQTPSGPSVEPSLVENNIFSLEASTHGQGLSVYADAWRKATTRHNIFYNCQRAFSFQPDDDNSRPEETGTMTFENNLMIVDVLLDKPSFITGQTNFAFNGATDSEVGGATNPQQVIIKNNSHLTTNRLGYGLSPASVVQLSTMDLKKLQFSDVYVENNITGTILAPDTNSDPNFNGGHTHANNVTTLRNLSGGNNSAVATTDKLIHPNRADYLVAGTLNGKVVQGGAFDGGRQGIRWANVPTLAQIDEIISTENVEWASSYPAQTLPAGGSYSNATDGTVEYGMTGGGTGGMAAWRTQATGKKASWQITHAGGVVGVGGYQYGASGYVAEKDPPGLEVRCAPAYSANDSGMYWGFVAEADRDSFIAGISGSYIRLSVLVTSGGSGDNIREGGYYAGNTNQVYNYYWDPNDNFRVKNTESSNTMIHLRGIAAAVNGPSADISDAWPDSGITGHLWGDYPKYSLTAQSTPF